MQIQFSDRKSFYGSAGFFSAQKLEKALLQVTYSVSILKAYEEKNPSREQNMQIQTQIHFFKHPYGIKENKPLTHCKQSSLGHGIGKSLPFG